MTDVAFHFGAPDKIAYACRLLRKATATGAKVAVMASASDLRNLDVSLWGVGATDFVTHCDRTSGETMRVNSSVALCASLSESPSGVKVLVNLDQVFPEGFETFERVIEVVSTDEDDRALARERWKTYTRMGYTIIRHDLALKS